MFTNAAKNKIIVNGKEYFFFCDNDAPLADTKEALFYYLKCIGQLEDLAKAQAEKAEAESAPAEIEIEEVQAEVE